MADYKQRINAEVQRAMNVAEEARAKLLDPAPEVEIPLAEDIAARCESLVGTMIPKIIGSGVRERLRELEAKLGKNNERIAFEIAKEVAHGKFFKNKNTEQAIEAGLRVGVAYLTLGIVTAPLEGITQVKLKRRNDGGQYLSVYFSGPIRSAGGTAAAMAVLISDYLRQLFDIGSYDPDDREVERYVIEADDYDHFANLQYKPSPEQIRFIVPRIPVEINGDPTELHDVLSFKDLPRVETNRIRGGMCLTLCEGIAGKAAKLLKRVKQYGKEYRLESWSWLQQFVDLKKKESAGEEKREGKITPNFTYMEEIPAGRPLFSDPSTPGGFRLRYGRSRNTGLAGIGLHPATMVILDSFPAVGTQLRLERPGKAGVVAPVDSILGPVVLLKNGEVLRIDSMDKAKEVLAQVSEVLFAGDILIATGEFSDRGHVLMPAGYCPEWWVQEYAKAKGIPLEEAPDPFTEKPDPATAIIISQKFSIPIHPEYTYPFHDLTPSELKQLAAWLFSAEVEQVDGMVTGLKVQNSLEKRFLELLLVPHKLSNNQIIIGKEALPLLTCLGYPERKILSLDANSSMELIEKVSPVIVREFSPTTIGGRMGRPEKAMPREMTGKPMVLFPVTDAGGRFRSVNEASSGKTITAELALRVCKSCGKSGHYLMCECGGKTRMRKRCVKCGRITESDEHCGLPTRESQIATIPIAEQFEAACAAMGYKPELLKGVKGMSSAEKIPERLGKGVLRAKYGLMVNKDGTIRYDSTDIPLTHFMPKEVGVTAEKLVQLGYEKDIHGKPLESDDQVLELYPQDILIPDHPDKSAVKWMINVANFIDDLLVKFYNMQPYYNISKKEDLIGHLVVGLAPHTSAGIVGRVVGFTRARAGFAHPAWHAGKRRNCDGDEDAIILMMDAFINFSRIFLPSSRGGKTMDVPLVLTTNLDAQEVDNEVWAMDAAWRLPLEFYQATLEYKEPDSVKIIRVKDHLNDLSGIGFTHPTSQMDAGPVVSSYTSLGSMLEKVEQQLELGRKLRAVDEDREAEIIVSSHFLKDIKGNIRTYCRQKLRCTKCNKKYRRIPLLGKCTCGGHLVLTVSQGSVEKYLEPSIKIAEKFQVSSYMRQELEILKRRLRAMFGEEKVKQTGLAGFLVKS